jgi:type II secretory pathway component PulF
MPTVNVPSGVVRRLPRRGAGASFLAAVLKALAVLIWLGTVAIIVIPGFDVISDSFSSDLTATLNALMNNNTVVAALIGLILGFVFFGLGEIIGLLNTIRRNTR